MGFWYLNVGVQQSALIDPSMGVFVISTRLLDRFIQEPLKDLTSELTERVSEMDKDMAALDKKRIYWERNKTEAQGNLQELIRQIQQAQGA